MKPFKRTVEKVLAWIANIILIVITGFLAYGSFFKISVLKDNQEFLNLFKDELAKNPNGVNLSAEQLLDYTIQGLKMYSVLLIVLVVVALLASFLMKKRILSGILFLLLAALMGTCSGLLDKYLMASPESGGVGMDRMLAQSWYNIYQCLMMAIVLLIYLYKRKGGTDTQVKFSWKWSILLISIFLSMADFAYFYALSLPGAMISIVSMVRRGSVIVSFLCGALLFREKNLKAKALDLCLVILGMIFLWIGSY